MSNKYKLAKAMKEDMQKELVNLFSYSERFTKLKRLEKPGCVAMRRLESADKRLTSAIADFQISILDVIDYIDGD